MDNKNKTYYLAGRPFSKESLMEYCRKKSDGRESKEFEKEVYRFILDWFSPEDHMLVKTSGSTGKPKEIRLLKKHMEASARATISFFDLKPEDKILHCLPMQFIAGKMMVVRALVGSLDLYCTEPSSKPEMISEEVAFAAMVPLQLSKLLQDAAGRATLAKISKLIIGGSFVPDSLEKSIQRMSTQVWQTYGMTETSTHIALRKMNGADSSEWYRPLPGISVGLNKQGCLVIDAPEIGVNDIVTSDLAELNENGMFQIKGRIDHVIISGGIKFHPEEIEHKISGVFPNDFFIGSKKDDELGEKLVLFIEKGEGTERKVFEIWQALEQKLRGHELPKEIIFLPEFNRTPSGKIVRNSPIYLKNRD